MPDAEPSEYDLAPEPRRPAPRRVPPPAQPAQPTQPPPARREPSRVAAPPASRGGAAGENGLTLEEQAGRISWLAPGLLCLMTALIPARSLDRMTAGVLLVFEGVIFLAGLVACGYAWWHWLRRREDGLAKGAIAGLLLNLLILVGLIAFAFSVAGGDLNP